MTDRIILTGDRLRKFEDKYIPEPNSGCWLWIAGELGTGYGAFTIDGRRFCAHRVSYEHHVANIPEGLVLDHLCRVRCCVNPQHLEPVTQQENVRRGDAGISLSKFYAQKTHCAKGHPWGGENLIVEPSGRRRCAVCRRENWKKKVRE